MTHLEPAHCPLGQFSYAALAAAGQKEAHQSLAIIQQEKGDGEKKWIKSQTRNVPDLSNEARHSIACTKQETHLLWIPGLNAVEFV